MPTRRALNSLPCTNGAGIVVTSRWGYQKFDPTFHPLDKRTNGRHSVPFDHLTLSCCPLLLPSPHSCRLTLMGCDQFCLYCFIPLHVVKPHRGRLGTRSTVTVIKLSFTLYAAARRVWWETRILTRPAQIFQPDFAMFLIGFALCMSGRTESVSVWWFSVTRKQAH